MLYNECRLFQNWLKEETKKNVHKQNTRIARISRDQKLKKRIKLSLQAELFLNFPNLTDIQLFEKGVEKEKKLLHFKILS